MKTFITIPSDIWPHKYYYELNMATLTFRNKQKLFDVSMRKGAYNEANILASNSNIFF